MELNDEERKALSLQLAQDTWKRTDDTIAAYTEHTISFGLASLRAPLILLSAGIAALLGFVSANAAQLQGMATETGRVFSAFIAGLVLAGASNAFAYLTQGLYTQDLVVQKRLFEHPYLDPAPGKQFRDRGRAAHALTAILVIGAYACFIYGAYVFYRLLERLL